MCSPLSGKPSNQGQAEEQGVRAVVDAFFGAFQRKDIDAVMSLWSAKADQAGTVKQNLTGTFTRVGAIELKTLVVKKLDFSGDEAIARVAVEMNAADAKTGNPAPGFGKLNRTLRLSKDDHGWKVIEYQPSEKLLALAIVAAKTRAGQQALMDANPDLVNIELESFLKQEGAGLARQGQHSSSFDTYGIAADIATRLGDRSGLARAFGSMGYVDQLRGDYVGSLEYLGKTLAVAQEINDKPVIAQALWMSGYSNQLLGNYTEALDFLGKALRFARDQGDTSNTAYALMNIGGVYERQGNLAEALTYLLQSKKLAEQIQEKRLVAACLRTIGTLEAEQDNLAQSLETLQASLKVFEEIGEKRGVAEVLNEIGIARRGAPEAFDAFASSLKIAEEIKDPALEAKILGNIGQAYIANHNFARASEYLQRSLKNNQEIGDQYGVCSSLQDLGAMHYEEGQYASAVDFGERAAAIAERLGSLETLGPTLTTVGSAYRKLNQPEKARQAFEKAIAAIEKMRILVAGGEQEQQQFLENRTTPYYAMADLLLDQNNQSEALEFAERAKARTLLDALGQGRVDITKMMTPEETKLEQSARSKLVSLNSQITAEKLRNNTDEQRLTSLTAQLEKARLEYEQAQMSIYAAHPELKVQRGKFQPISVEECGALLPDPDYALLEFVALPDSVALFVLTRGRNDAGVRLTAHRIAIQEAKLNDLCELFRTRLANRDLTSAEPARKLYDLLLKPAAAGLDSKTKLIIVPDGILWDLPFQALESRPDHFLLEDYSISRAPSLTALREMSRVGRGRNGADRTVSLLALANPLIRGDSQAYVKGAFMGARLDPLPQAETQVRMIGKLYGPARSRVYVGAEATEDRLKADAGNFRILHIAGHGIVNNTSPMYSQIVLSRADSSDDDGLLEAWEIMNLSLRADLAVLSACDTARGRVRSGEGIIGLSWAFFVAGCPATVVSQWSVDAESTTALMVEFHRNLLAGKNKVAALREAELKLLKSSKYSHPFYWAPFVVMGDPN
jgi:CHAT domain-containing protein